MLKKHSIIAVIAPAGIPDMKQIQKGVALLVDWGCQVREGRYLRERYQGMRDPAQRPHLL